MPGPQAVAFGETLSLRPETANDRETSLQPSCDDRVNRSDHPGRDQCVYPNARPLPSAPLTRPSKRSASTATAHLGWSLNMPGRGAPRAQAGYASLESAEVRAMRARRRVLGLMVLRAPGPGKSVPDGKASAPRRKSMRPAGAAGWRC